MAYISVAVRFLTRLAALQEVLDMLLNESFRCPDNSRKSFPVAGTVVIPVPPDSECAFRSAEYDVIPGHAGQRRRFEGHCITRILQNRIHRIRRASIIFGDEDSARRSYRNRTTGTQWHVNNIDPMGEEIC